MRRIHAVTIAKWAGALPGVLSAYRRPLWRSNWSAQAVSAEERGGTGSPL